MLNCVILTQWHKKQKKKLLRKQFCINTVIKMNKKFLRMLCLLRHENPELLKLCILKMRQKDLEVIAFKRKKKQIFLFTINVKRLSPYIHSYSIVFYWLWVDCKIRELINFYSLFSVEGRSLATIMVSLNIILVKDSSINSLFLKICFTVYFCASHLN